jgi:hypothetical protein
LAVLSHGDGSAARLYRLAFTLRTEAGEIRFRGATEQVRGFLDAVGGTPAKPRLSQASTLSNRDVRVGDGKLSASSTANNVTKTRGGRMNGVNARRHLDRRT